MAFSSTINDNGSPVKKGVRAISYNVADTAGDGAPINIPDAVSVTLTFGGTFASGTVKVQVSNDDVTYSDAGWHDPSAPGTINATPISSAGSKCLAKQSLGFRYTRLVLASGGATTTIDAAIVVVMVGGRN